MKIILNYHVHKVVKMTSLFDSPVLALNNDAFFLIRSLASSPRFIIDKKTCVVPSRFI